MDWIRINIARVEAGKRNAVPKCTLGEAVAEANILSKAAQFCTWEGFFVAGRRRVPRRQSSLKTA